MTLKEVKEILNEKVEDKYDDQEAIAIYAVIKQLVQIDIKRIEEYEKSDSIHQGFNRRAS